MGEGVRDVVRVRIHVHELLAQIEDNVCVGTGLVVDGPGKVHQEVMGHHECVVEATALQQDVDSIGAGVHERHLSHHLAFVLHPAGAPSCGLQLVHIVDIGIDFGCLHCDIALKICRSLLRPYIDVPGHQILQRELAAPAHAYIQVGPLLSHLRISSLPSPAATGVPDHGREACKARMLANRRLQLEAALPPFRARPKRLQTIHRRIVRQVSWCGDSLVVMEGLENALLVVVLAEGTHNAFHAVPTFPGEGLDLQSPSWLLLAPRWDIGGQKYHSPTQEGHGQRVFQGRA
mmetsp:Transcript_106024/g.253038  ORF Transcript_106024/g.253038 Transcript_106024/m.253038 type:complete len:290 (-) Transcript_106024:7-876(-)